MAKIERKLTEKVIAHKLKEGPGRHHDGSGLYLQIASETSASWLLRSDRVDPDLLDERARYQLDYANPRDLVRTSNPN